jgi:hypothetical protein
VAPVDYWRVPREWPGETCFIVAGGTSVEQHDLTRLKGRRVIAINTSWESVPFADFLIFGDARWYRENDRRLRAFNGRIVTMAFNISGKRILRMRKASPPGFSTDPTELAMRRTTLHAAINFAVHLGPSPIVLLGADGQLGPDGRTHHHRKHPWPQRPNCWAEQRADLETLRKPLKKRGIDVVNASPGSAWADIWPVVELENYL